MSQTSMCPVCRTGALVREAYVGVIRAGSFGMLTPDERIVLECGSCGVQKLQGEPLAYENDDYRLTYDGGADADRFHQLHDGEQAVRLARVGVERLRNAVVADYGCGAGSFIDLVRGVARETLAIEPSSRFREGLATRGHRAFPAAEQVPTGHVDVAVCFQVIEHVEDPLLFLRELHRGLRPGGVVVLSTPNRGNILAQLAPPGYAEFFYRTAHMWYFDSRALGLAAGAAGFEDVHLSTEQTYDLSNAMCWLRDRKPTGNGKIGCFDAQIDAAWKAFVESRMMGDNLWLTARR